MSDPNDNLVEKFKNWLRAAMPKSGEQTVAIYTASNTAAALAIQVFSVSTPLDALAERLLDWVADQWVDQEIATPGGRGMFARLMRAREGALDSIVLMATTLNAWLRQIRELPPTMTPEEDGRTPFRIRRAWVVDANFHYHEWFGQKDRPVFIRDRRFIPCVRQIVPRRCTLHTECREPWKEDLAVVCAAKSVYEVTLFVQDTIFGCDERRPLVAEWIGNLRRRFQGPQRPHSPHVPPNDVLVDRRLEEVAVELYACGMLTDERPRFSLLQAAVRHERKVAMEGWDPKRVNLLEDWRPPWALTPEERAAILTPEEIAVAKRRARPTPFEFRNA